MQAALLWRCRMLRAEPYRLSLALTRAVWLRANAPDGPLHPRAAETPAGSLQVAGSAAAGATASGGSRDGASGRGARGTKTPPPLEVGEVIRRYGSGFLAARGSRLSVQQRKVLAALGACRTAAMGGHLQRCTACGTQTPLGFRRALPANAASARSARPVPSERRPQVATDTDSRAPSRKL